MTPERRKRYRLHRPGLPAVQQFSRDDREPLMKTEHHHAFDMAVASGAFNAGVMKIFA